MDDPMWWWRQMDGSRTKYALCSGGFNADGFFVHDGRHCACGDTTDPETGIVYDRDGAVVCDPLGVVPAGYKKVTVKRLGDVPVEDVDGALAGRLAAMREL